MEKLWTTAEAAQCLGINDVDGEELVRQGKLTGYKLGGQFLRFRPDQVAALKGQLRVMPTASTPSARRRSPWWFHSLQDLLYFYDFYIVSAVCLAVLVIYLVAST